MNLRVQPDGVLRITCSKTLPRLAIQRFVQESTNHIQKRLMELERRRLEYPEKQFLSGETFLLFGAIYTLQVIWTWTPKVKVSWSPDSTVNLIEMRAPLVSTLEHRQKAFYLHCKRWATTHFSRRVSHFSRQLQAEPAGVRIRGQRTVWGTCNSKRQISLNWKLIAAPFSVMDYVVVHELSHLSHMNHSRDFWDLVERHDPNWKLAVSWLKKHEMSISHQFSKLG